MLLPKQAPWLPDLELEVFSFPRGRHDDQVDSISQALSYEPELGWTDETMANFSEYVTGLCFEAAIARHMRRPW
jgi:hypothetical protein